jgi:hypothetical protein
MPAAQMKFVSEEALVGIIGRVVAQVFEATDAKIAAAMAEFVFKGQWTENTLYKKRNLVTMGGAIHICNAEQTTTRPGVGTDWTLLVPKPRDGRDGKDGKDFVPPEPPLVRTTRSLRS